MQLLLIVCVLFLAGCDQIGTNEFVRSDGQVVFCPVTEPDWLKPPEDPAVSGSPDFGYYYSNDEASILASAWWVEQEEVYLRAGEPGVKEVWFSPEGVE